MIYSYRLDVVIFFLFIIDSPNSPNLVCVSGHDIVLNVFFVVLLAIAINRVKSSPEAFVSP